MSGSTVVVGWGLAAALLVLVVVAAVAGLVGRIGTGRAAVVAAVRATLQLAAVSSVILVLVRYWWATALFVLLMFAVAAWTSARRITKDRGGAAAGLSIAAGAIPVVVIVVSRAVPLTGIALVPVAGIVIGGAMTATSQAGRRALDQLHTRWGEYEAALSLGFTDRDAAIEVIRPSAADALVPPLDQTRTVGLVTLPGAFVGVLLGSGDPVQAGAAQLLVLIGLLAAESVAVLVTVELVARGRLRREVTARTRPATRGHGPGRLSRTRRSRRGDRRPSAARA